MVYKIAINQALRLKYNQLRLFTTKYDQFDYHITIMTDKILC